jgi:hypothetical protein
VMPSTKPLLHSPNPTPPADGSASATSWEKK